MDKIEVIKAMFVANAEAIKERDREWREWLNKVLDPEEQDAAEAIELPPDCRN